MTANFSRTYASVAGAEVCLRKLGQAAKGHAFTLRRIHRLIEIALATKRAQATQLPNDFVKTYVQNVADGERVLK